MARVRNERAAVVPPMRAMAVAALALLVVGGLFSMRALLGRPGSSFDYQPAAGFATQDAGPAARGARPAGRHRTASILIRSSARPLDGRGRFRPHS
jgi:hypothetical protein